MTDCVNESGHAANLTPHSHCTRPSPPPPGKGCFRVSVRLQVATINPTIDLRYYILFCYNPPSQ
eukprot:scaffold358_cov207-Alexandrium_tamarense.AAC.45